MQDYRQMPYVDQFPVAMAYVPWQKLQDVYEPEAALTFGTLFPELNKPFTAGGKRDG